MRRIDLAADGGDTADSIRTGYPSVDRCLGGGIRVGDLVVIGGDSGSGKSALALSMALRIASSGVPTYFLSTEMSPERVMERALAIEGRTSVDDIRAGALDEITRAGVGGAAVRIRDAVPQVEVSPFGAAGLLSKLEEIPKGGIVLIDSLEGVIPDSARPLAEEEAAVIRTLKQGAVGNDVAVILTASTRTSRSEAPEERPSLADFGSKDAVRQHADVVTALYREEMYNPGNGVEGGTEFLILKNRNGATGYVDLYFYKQWLRFEDMLDPDR